MQSHVFVSMTHQELIALVKDCLKEVFQECFHTHNTSPLQLLPAHETQYAEVILTIKDVCKLFGVSKPTIHTWKKKGILPYHTKGRRVYFIESEVMASLASTGSGRRKK